MFQKALKRVIERAAKETLFVPGSRSISLFNLLVQSIPCLLLISLQ